MRSMRDIGQPTLAMHAIDEFQRRLRAVSRSLVLCLSLSLLPVVPVVIAAEPHDDSRLIAQKTFAEAEQLRTQGTAESIRKAMEKYTEALRLWHAVGNREEEANTCNTLGLVYDALDEKQMALGYYSQALPLLRAMGDRQGEAATLNRIGNTYEAMGEAQKALSYFNQA